MRITTNNIKYEGHPNGRVRAVSCRLIHQKIENPPLLFLAIVVMTCSISWAEEINTIPFDTNNISVIDSSDVSRNKGITNVNITAGDGNAQANLGVIAVGLDGGKKLTQPIVDQTIQKLKNQTPDRAVASITGQAFSNSSGWTAINQISGQANMQANIMVIGIGEQHEIAAVDDQLLAQAYSGAGLTGSPSASQRPKRTATIDDTALQGISGVVQVNQTAGARNVTSNTFVFQVTGNALQ